MKKRTVSLVIVGHVDAGKSTLMGHLLYLSGAVDQTTMKKIENDSHLVGKDEDSFAWIMSQDETERSRGVTIDVSMTELETTHLKITVLDAPGHQDFIPNMIAGASQADNALLVIDASDPLVRGGQTQEHVLLCRSLGISNFIVVINKMDQISFDETEYEKVKTTIDNLLKSYGTTQFTMIPTSAKSGDNLKMHSEQMPWYHGQTLYEALDSIVPPRYDVENPFLMCISESTEGSKSLIVSGKIESGYVCRTDRIKVLPLNLNFKVQQIHINERAIQYAHAGMVATMTLVGDNALQTIPIGLAVTDPDHNLPCVKEFTARVQTFEMTTPILKGSRLIFHRHAIDTIIKVVEIKPKLNQKTKEVEKLNPGYAIQNTLSEIVFSFEESETGILMDLYEKSKSFGRFILRNHGKTIGFGSIASV